MSPTESAVGGGGMRAVGPTPQLWPPPESLRPTLVGRRHMVSAGHPLVADVAVRALEAGGNAVDAGVAAGLAANVVQVDMCNFGGVAPALVRPAGSDTVFSIAGLGEWGSGATVDAHLARHGGDMPLGGGAAVVPGAPAAWIAALKRFGTWTFARAAEPAVELALGGFPIDRRLAESFELTGRTFRRWSSSRAIYWPHGRPPRIGERLAQRDLGGLLGRLADEERGPSREAALDAVHAAFYAGEVAERIARSVSDDGGWMDVADLERFNAEVEPAAKGAYAGWDVWVTGAWTQGPALLQTLNVLSGFELAELGHNSVDYLHLLAEAIKLVFSDREAFYGDPRKVDVPLEWLLSRGHADELRARIQPAAALPDLPTLTGRAGRLDTTYLCTVDAAGNAFSATPSDTLDGGPVVPDLGIVVSPRGVQSRLDPDHPASVAPGKRPRLTPSPALATRRAEGGEDRMVWPFGSPGGDVILQSMLQAFLNVVEFDMTPQQAVEAPRAGCFSFPDSFFPHVHLPGRLNVEARVPAEVRAELAARGHDVVAWPAWEFDAGGVSMVRDLNPPAGGERVLVAAADPRRICYAAGR